MNLPNKSIENTGLTKEDLARITEVFARNSHIEAVLLFGSRAMGTHHAGSDVDLAVKGKLLNPGTLSQFRQELEALHLPFFFDVLHYDALKDPALKEQVDRVGVIL